MPQIDKLIEKMRERDIERVLLISAQPMRLFTSGREATGPTMPMQQIQSVIQEVIPPHLLPQFANLGQLSFPYQSPEGLFNLSVERRENELQIEITPFESVGSPVTTSQPLRAPSLPTPPSLPITAPPRQTNKLLPIGGGVAVLLVILGTAWFVNNTKVAQEKAAVIQSQQVQAQQASEMSDRYTQAINGLSQIGVNIRTIGSYQIAKEDNAVFSAAVADLERQIKADTAVEGSETSGRKAELLKALQDSALRNSPSTRAASINNQTVQTLKNHMLATGQPTLKEADVQQTVTLLKGVDAWLSLYNADESGAFNQKVQELFPG